MAPVKRLPYLTPSADRVSLGEWLNKQRNSLLPLEPLLPDWDPAVSIAARIEVAVDSAGIYQDTQLHPADRVSIQVLWDSPGTVLRGSGPIVMLDPSSTVQQVQLSAHVDGRSLAKSVQFMVTVVLQQHAPGIRPHPLAPKLPGSSLYRSVPHRVQIEGSGARFPVEITDFNSPSLSTPPNAAWMLFWNPNNLHETVLGDMRLYINSAHKRVVQAVSDSSAEFFDLREAIRIDTARTVIHGALNNDDFVENPDQYEVGSVGASARGMLRIYFPGQTVREIARRRKHAQSFDTELQDRLHAFWSQDT